MLETLAITTKQEKEKSGMQIRKKEVNSFYLYTYDHVHGKH